MFDFVLLLIVGLGMVFAGHFVISRIFAGNLDNLSRSKSFLLNELNLELTGNPARDLELVKKERESLNVEFGKYNRSINELISHIDSKENDVLFLNVVESYLSDTQALQTTFNKLEYNGDTGELLYYVVYEQNKIPENLSPMEIPNDITINISRTDEIEFSDYVLKLVNLQVGE
jgi:hypothetical protein